MTGVQTCALPIFSLRAIARVRFDNAILMSRRVYLTDLDAFDLVFTRYHADVRRTIQAIIAAAKSNREHPFDAVRALASSGTPASAADTAR